MWFTSTSNPTSKIDCRTAMLSAYAPDGGLLLPAEIPQVDTEELRRLAKLSYVSLLADLLARFVDDKRSDTFSAKNLERILGDIPDLFDCKDDVIPIHQISVPTNDGSKKAKLAVAELYHGPSLAFKDLATIPACRLMDACLAENGDGDGKPRRGLVVVSTSGDTGASVAGAVACTKRLDALILLPGAGRVAKIQERQTITWPGDNVHVFVGDASSDSLDLLAGRMQEGSPLCDERLLAYAKEQKFLLTSLNSLNPLRVLAQLAPFFYVYLKQCPTADRKVCFILPTGGGGNLAAGLLARRMGLPIEFVVALNANASIPHLVKFFDDKNSSMTQAGTYDVPASVRTLAPAMDMGIPYNLPRIVHLATGSNNGSPSEAITFTADATTGQQRVTTSRETLEKVRSNLYGVEAASDAEIEESMRIVAAENDGYVVCPHTATAVSAARKIFAKENGEHFAGIVVVATASPAKFLEALERADLAKNNKEVNELLDKLNKLPIRAQSLESPQGSSESVPYDDWFGVIGNYLKKSVFTKN